jgi:hypothetical protein
MLPSKTQAYVDELAGLVEQLKTLVETQAHQNDQADADHWILDTDQMIFMMQHHNMIEAAYASEDLDSLRLLAASEAFKSVFGEMSFDEAYDRYECALEDNRADS